LAERNIPKVVPDTKEVWFNESTDKDRGSFCNSTQLKNCMMHSTLFLAAVKVEVEDLT
jgi:hypothetical protein